MQLSEELSNRIVSAIADGYLSIKAICDELGITRVQYIDWKRTDADFAERVKIAEEVKYENRLHLAWCKQRVLIEGYEYDEVTEESETFTPEGSNVEVTRIVKRKIVRKKVGPSTSAVIHALKSLDPRFNQPERFEHGGEVITKLPNIFLSMGKKAKALKPGTTN